MLNDDLQDYLLQQQSRYSEEEISHGRSLATEFMQDIKLRYPQLGSKVDEVVRLLPAGMFPAVLDYGSEHRMESALEIGGQVKWIEISFGNYRGRFSYEDSGRGARHFAYDLIDGIKVESLAVATLLQKNYPLVSWIVNPRSLAMIYDFPSAWQEDPAKYPIKRSRWPWGHQDYVQIRSFRGTFNKHNLLSAFKGLELPI